MTAVAAPLVAIVSAVAAALAGRIAGHLVALPGRGLLLSMSPLDGVINRPCRLAMSFSRTVLPWLAIAATGRSGVHPRWRRLSLHPGLSRPHAVAEMVTWC